MPTSKTGRPDAVAVSSIALKLGSACATFQPSSISLPPSSIMTASAPLRSDQPKRTRPPYVVSPDNPAFTNRAEVLCCANQFANTGTIPCAFGRPYPAVRLSPKTTTRGSGSAACAASPVEAASPAIIPRRVNFTFNVCFIAQGCCPGAPISSIKQDGELQ